MAEQFANHAGTTLAAAITSTTRPVTFSVASNTGLPAGGNFRVVFASGEIMLITAISGTSLTGSNVEGTAAATHPAGETITHILTAGALAQLEADVQSATAAGLPYAGPATNGILSKTDWNTFNNKQAQLSYTPLNSVANLADLGSVSAARTNLGLGSAATMASSAFDAAGAAAAILSGPSIFSGQVTFGAVVFNGACYSNPSSPEYFNTSNVSWQEFQLISVKGSAAANDQLALQYNSRSTSGGSDAWASVLTVAAQTGALAFNTAVAFNQSVTFNATANLNGQTFSGNATFSGGLTFSGPITMTGVPTVYQPVTIYPGGGNWALTLQGASGGASSGIQLINTTASTGRYFTLYSASDGSFRIDDNTSSANRFAILNTGVVSQLGSGWQNWTPTVTGTGSMTVSSPSGTFQYVRIGPIVYFYIAMSMTLGGTLSSGVYFTLPIASAAANLQAQFGFVTTPSISFDGCFPSVNAGATQLLVYYKNGSAYPAAGTYTFYLSGFYRCA